MSFIQSVSDVDMKRVFHKHTRVIADHSMTISNLGKVDNVSLGDGVNLMLVGVSGSVTIEAGDYEINVPS